MFGFQRDEHVLRMMCQFLRVLAQVFSVNSLCVMLEAPVKRRATGRLYSIAVVEQQGDGRLIVLALQNCGESSVAVAAEPANLRGDNGECMQSTSVTIDGPACDLVFARVDSSLLKSVRGDE